MMVEQDKAEFPRDFNLSQRVRPTQDGRIFEFIGTDTFGAEWYTRQQFEIDAGRDMEPILYTPIYSVIADRNLPKLIDRKKIGPGGVILQMITEGGEVKFATVQSSEEVVRLYHYGVGLEYSDDLVEYNELWSVPIVERAVGTAYNALQNHVHFAPIIQFAYQAANQTGAVTSGDTLEEDYLLTLEAAITNSRLDATNPRRGPYALLVSSSNAFMWERALTRVAQQGFTKQSSAIGAVSDVIAYDGWTGEMGGEIAEYTGVAAGTSYLINLGYRDMDFQSYQKQGLEEYGRQEDISRFLLQVVWDTRFGMYANPERAVEEITLPTP